MGKGLQVTFIIIPSLLLFSALGCATMKVKSEYSSLRKSLEEMKIGAKEKCKTFYSNIPPESSLYILTEKVLDDFIACDLDNSSAVVVKDVEPVGQAGKNGVRPGDFIKSIDGNERSHPAQLGFGSRTINIEFESPRGEKRKLSAKGPIGIKYRFVRDDAQQTRYSDCIHSWLVNYFKYLTGHYAAMAEPTKKFNDYTAPLGFRPKNWKENYVLPEFVGVETEARVSHNQNAQSKREICDAKIDEWAEQNGRIVDSNEEIDLAYAKIVDLITLQALSNAFSQMANSLEQQRTQNRLRALESRAYQPPPPQAQRPTGGMLPINPGR